MSDKYLWKAKSGHFAGVRREDAFYNANGEHFGIFRGDVLHSSETGDAIAKIVYEDYLVKHSAGGRIGIYRYANSGRHSVANRPPVAVAGEDPELG